MAGGELIVIFTKPALPGRVKTRLLPLMSPEDAVLLHIAALTDVITAARRVGGSRVEIFVSGGAGAADEFHRRFPELGVRLQRGDDLGARLGHAFDDAFASGAERTLIVGSDHPTLPHTHLERGLTALGTFDVVFGPSRDGGYYAVGARRESWPRARVTLQDIPWSSAGVLEASLRRAAAAGLEVALLPEWYDVDRPADLELLRRDAQPGSASAGFLREWEARRRAGSRGSGRR